MRRWEPRRLAFPDAAPSVLELDGEVASHVAPDTVDVVSGVPCGVWLRVDKLNEKRGTLDTVVVSHPRFLSARPGKVDGSCFPKDVQALVDVGRGVGVELGISAAVHARNTAARERLARQVIERLGPDLSGRHIAIWGLAFKPNTDDVREAPAITIAELLLEAGATIAAHDPRALDSARRVLGDRVGYCEDAYAALEGADALLTTTEWMEYRSPDFDRIRQALKQPLIFDGRNIYDRGMMQRYAFEYYSVGRPPYTP